LGRLPIKTFRASVRPTSARIAFPPNCVGHIGRRAERLVLRRVGPEQATQIDLRPSVDPTEVANASIPMTMEQLWVCGLRNLGAGGHAVILVANCFRALETIGWREAEQVLRFVVQDIYLLSAEKPDLYWPTNTARADRHLEKLPPTSAAGT